MLLSDLEEIGAISFTTDLWTSGNNKAIMAITATWVTKDFKMYEAVIAFREIKGEHSGVNIAAVFYEALKEFGIENKVLFLIFFKSIIMLIY